MILGIASPLHYIISWQIKKRKPYRCCINRSIDRSYTTHGAKWPMSIAPSRSLSLSHQGHHVLHVHRRASTTPVTGCPELQQPTAEVHACCVRTRGGASPIPLSPSPHTRSPEKSNYSHTRGAMDEAVVSISSKNQNQQEAGPPAGMPSKRGSARSLASVRAWWAGAGTAGRAAGAGAVATTERHADARAKPRHAWASPVRRRSISPSPTGPSTGTGTGPGTVRGHEPGQPGVRKRAHFSSRSSWKYVLLLDCRNTLVKLYTR